MDEIRDRVLWIFDFLSRHCPLDSGWPEGKWPITGTFLPPQFEVVVGTVLTQNTKWGNVERALSRMVNARLTSAVRVQKSSLSRLEDLLRPVGFYRQKSRTLLRLAECILGFDGDFYAQISRDGLLRIKGVGPETADTILLYACNREEFVVDAYTRRVLGRCGLLGSCKSDQEVKDLLESCLPLHLSIYRRFHALLVEHGKRTCRKSPRCEACALRGKCFTFGNPDWAGASRSSP